MISAALSRATTLGLSLVAGFGLFFWLGYALGKKFGHAEGGALAGAGCGFLYGAYELWKTIRDIEQRDQPRDPARRDQPPGAHDAPDRKAHRL